MSRKRMPHYIICSLLAVLLFAAAPAKADVIPALAGDYNVEYDSKSSGTEYSLSVYSAKEIVRNIAEQIRGDDSLSIGYQLSDGELRTLAAICVREQGANLINVRACASHMCNYYELHGANKYRSPYEAVVYSGWYGSAGKNMATARSYAPSQAVLDAVYDVICLGNRDLPEYVDEFDCLSDIASASNNGAAFNPRNRSQYISGVTRIHNVYGSTYTFYCFPDGAGGVSDAFGYIG